MLDITKIRAISLDLDDTLWPIWPTIARAEQALSDWLRQQAPKTADVFADPAARLQVRAHIVSTRPELGHNLSALRRESIRLALQRSGEDTALAEPAFEVFFAERMRVDLFADARPALAFLARRFPVVAVSNGNADVGRVGLGEFFVAGLSAQQFGVGKPDPRIFHAAAAAVGMQAADVLHVGDDAALDVLGGNNAGMQTVWVNRGEQVWAHEVQPDETVTDLTQLCALLRAASP